MKLGKYFTSFLVIVLIVSVLSVSQTAEAAPEQVANPTTTVFINEIHYDNTGTDVGEAIEVAGPAGTDLTGWYLVSYNGSTGALYDNTSLGGVIADLGSGYGVVVENFPTNGLQNGSPDGVALVDGTNTVIQFLSYEGVFTATDGPAAGLDSTDIGVSENGSGAIGNSLQLTGSGTTYGDFTWAGEQVNTFGAVNTGQSFGGAPTAKALVVNEIDYDQPGTDTAEFVEIRNNDSVSVDLSAYSLQFVNGNGGSVYDTISLPSVSLAAGDYFVVCANAATVANCDLDDSPDTNFIQNGAPDAVALYFGSTLVDTVSYEGDTVAPYTEGSGAGLVDDGANATEGISRCPDGSDTDQNNVDFSRLEITPGAANVFCGPSVAEPKINEFSASTTGVDVEYVEIFGEPNTDYSAYTVLEIEGDSSGAGIVDEVIAIGTTDTNGFFLANLAANTLENGTISLLLVKNFTGSFGDDLDTDNDGAFDVTPWDAVVDAVSVNDGGSGDFTYGIPVLYAYYDGAAFAPGGASRIPDGFDTDAASDWVRNDFDLAGIPGYSGSITLGEAYNTPGAMNEIYVPPPEMCGDPFTPIYYVQGNGAASPLVGTEVAIEGVVVGDFQNNASDDSGDLNGFFVQDLAGDGDPLTSDAVFVYAPDAMDVSVGDAVRVRGSVSEYHNQTEVGASQIWSCSTGNSVPAPVSLSLPVNSVDDFEAYEGMLVTFPQDLVISEYYNYDRFGEIVLTTHRHMTPTAEFEPGSPEALQAAQDYLLDKVTLDDGRSSQNPDPAIHPNGDVFDLTNLFRGGDIVANVTGLLDQFDDPYRVQPIQGSDYTPVNSRPSQPDDVGGNLKVASFNVLNYFTTLDYPTGNPMDNTCGPLQNQECRGADNEEEFTRQRDKIIAAISAIDADVVGLIEIENNPGDVPTADLVSGLNDVMGAGTYDYIATGAFGTDAIRQAFIYKPASVSPLGDFAVLDDPSFTDPLNYGQEKSRPALAQTFVVNDTGGVFTAVVNHLKSKGSSCGPGDDDPEAGSCNLTRTLGAQALVDWLATDPTGSGDGDFLIIGDLNSYDKEDPIDVLIAGGYSDQVFQNLGEDAYSYVFDGQLGYLDHALGNADMSADLTGVTIWHINADEPDLIDYDTTFKQAAQAAIYAPDAYRSSDHDPVIVGLELTTEAEVYELINDVQKLLDEGVLNGGQANALTSKLENVLAKLAQGNTNAAANQLGAFINQVEDFVFEGILTAEQGDLLIKSAALLVEALNQ